MTPFEAKGWKAADKFRVIYKKYGHGFKVGSIVTLYSDDGSSGPRFIDCEGSKWFCEFSELERIEPEWNGEGLPPVGTVISVNSKKFGWVDSKVLAVTGCMIIVSYIGKNGIEGSLCHTEIDEHGNKTHLPPCDASGYRPIRTDREKAIDEIMECTGLRARDGAKEVATALYDAGYRKQ